MLLQVFPYVVGDYEAAIREHQQELSLSESLDDVIGRAVANRKIGECYAEMGNIKAALKVSKPEEQRMTVRFQTPSWICVCVIESLQHQQCHLDLAHSVGDHAEVQRALATIGRTYLFRYESDQSKSSLKKAEDAFRKSLAIVDERLGGLHWFVSIFARTIEYGGFVIIFFLLQPAGTVPDREIAEMKARLFLNLGIVCDHLGESKHCSEFIRRSVFIAV